MAVKKPELLQQPVGTKITYEQVNTLLMFVKLWTYIGNWTRALMFSIAGNQPGKEALVNELYATAGKLYNAFNVFYGPVISQQLLNLVSNFITSEWRLLEAMKAGDQASIDQNTVSLYQNATDIASLLASVNLYWDQNQWGNLIYQYIKLIIDEMAAILAGEYEREIAIYKQQDQVTDLMGSYMARGIAASQTS